MIRIATTFMLTLLLAALPASAIDFLGVELCQGSVDTQVKFSPGSSLVLESVEIGDSGGLVMLLSARSGKVMNHVDDLMTGLTGQRGKGDADSLEWSDGRLTGVAQRVAKKYAALAVASTDQCSGADPAPVPVPTAAEVDAAAASVSAEPPQPVEAETATPSPDPAPVAAIAASSATVAVSSVPSPSEPAPVAPAEPDFKIVGAISHEAADPTWVDVMGVIANHTDTGYKLATFDLSFFGPDGSLICVDTISVSVLKAGQERAFRDAIRCTGYASEMVAETRLQFAGGF